MAVTSYNPGPEASFKGPSTRQSWTKSDCSQILVNLKNSIDRLVDGEVKRKDSQTKQVQKEFERRKSGGFLSSIASGPLSDYKAKISEAVTNPSESSVRQQGFMDQYLGYLDMGQAYVGLTSEMVSGVMSNVVNELNVVNQISEAAGLGSLVPSGQDSACNASILVSTVNTVVRVAEASLNLGAKQVFSVQATLGLALEAYPDLYAGIMSLPAGTLAILLTNKKTILDRIESIVKTTVSLVMKITEDDYPDDHRSIVLSALGRLEEADGDLGQVESTLEQGGRFLAANWDRAENTIEETGDDLLSISASPRPGYTFVKILQLVGYQKNLELMTQILSERQAKAVELVGYLGRFKTTFDSGSNFKNLAAPLVQQVRCMLRLIMDDMEKSLDVNSILNFYLKEKQWGAQLVGLAILMKNTGHLGKGLSSNSTSLNSAADQLSSSIGALMDEYLAGESYNLLLQLLSSFLREMKRKTASNVDPEILAGIGDAILVETARLKTMDSAMEELLFPFNDTFAQVGLGVAQAVAGFVNIVGEQGLDNIVDAIATGNWEGLFGLDALKNQLEAVALQAVGDLLQCCKDNAGDGDARRRLVRMGQAVQMRQRSKQVYDRYLKGFSEEYVKSTYGSTIPGIQGLKADVTRVSRAKCMTGGTGTLPDQIKGSGLTLT